MEVNLPDSSGAGLTDEVAKYLPTFPSIFRAGARDVKPEAGHMLLKRIEH